MNFTSISDSEIIPETLELKWSIPNHQSVISSEGTISAGTRICSVTSSVNGVTYKWQVGYKMVNFRSFTLCEKIVSPGSCQITPVDWALFYKNQTEGQWRILWKHQFKNPKPLCLYPEIIIPGLQWTLNSWFSVDQEGTFNWKSQMIVLHKKHPDAALNRFGTISVRSLLQNMESLLNDKESADLKIVCSDGIELQAHKLILSVRNPVFASMFTSPMMEKNTGIMHVEDVSSKTMKILLHYLYTGNLPEESRFPETIVEFVYAAGKYQLLDVLELLDNVLGDSDHGENTLILLNLTDKLDLKKAEKSLFHRVKQNVLQMNRIEDLFKMFKDL